jgi:hypothetical protein
MLGTYLVQGGKLVFQPRFPLAAGVRYRAVFRTPGGSPVEASFDGPKKDLAPSARVERIYPSTDVFPMNVLKFYVLFSEPMSRGEAWKRIHLLDENGKAIESVFVEIEQELWDPAYRRLTVLFDPGRIKRGLVPNQQMGTPIVEGKKYTLVIDREFHDARGAPLLEGFRKSFRGGPADRTPPDPKQWRLTEPKAGTRDALVVNFPDPMDSALLQRLLEVSGASGAIRGTVTLDRQETQWLFTPADPWKAGDYKLVADTGLEDLAGNRIGREFDVDTKEHPPDPNRPPKVSLPFRVTSAR